MIRCFLLIFSLLLFSTPALQAQTTQPHGIYVVSPGGNRRLLHQDNVEGQAIFVLWRRVDNGQIMNWKSVDSQIDMWDKAGKPTALIVWLASLGPFSAIPDYVLNTLPPTVRCMQQGTGTYVGPVPDYLSPNWQMYVAAFIGKLLQRYGNDPRISYIRIGPLMGGETFPTCLPEMISAYGMNEPDLEQYVDGVLLTEYQNKGSVPLMVALNCYGSCDNYDYPNHVAATAGAYGIGVGQESMQSSDIDNYQQGNPTTADWASIFALYPSVFHELQFNPNSYKGTNLLLPFAGEQGANVVEMEALAVVNPAFQQSMTNFDDKTK